MSETLLRVAGIVHDSITDGPGLRMTVFTQGCPHHCPGCHNPHTFDPQGGESVSVSSLIAQLDTNPLTMGVTLSGGEPFMQAQALLPFAQAVKARSLSLWAYSGYTFEQLTAREDARALLALCDVLVDGPFVLAQRSLALRYRGSHNQRVLDVQASLATGSPVLWAEA